MELLTPPQAYTYRSHTITITLVTTQEDLSFCLLNAGVASWNSGLNQKLIIGWQWQKKAKKSETLVLCCDLDNYVCKENILVLGPQMLNIEEVDVFRIQIVGPVRPSLATATPFLRFIFFRSFNCCFRLVHRQCPAHHKAIWS